MKSTRYTVCLDVCIVSDVICPWCYLGIARLDKALVQLSQHWQTLTVRKRWIPYLLNPSVPIEKSIPRRKMYIKKFGGNINKVESMERTIAAQFQEEGLPAYNLNGHVGSTLTAHRLSELAVESDSQSALMESLFRRYHIEGRSPSDLNNLVEAAQEVRLVVNNSLTKESIMNFLQSDRKIDQVAAHLQSNTEVFPMLSGVPHFRFAIPSKEKPAEFIHAVVPGAQDPATFMLALVKFFKRAGYVNEVAEFAAKSIEMAKVMRKPGNL